MTIYYAAIKWSVEDGPNHSDVTNDLEILAMTLIEEHGWSVEQVESALDGAITAAYEADDGSER